MNFPACAWGLSDLTSNRRRQHASPDLLLRRANADGWFSLLNADEARRQGSKKRSTLGSAPEVRHHVMKMTIDYGVERFGAYMRAVVAGRLLGRNGAAALNRGVAPVPIPDPGTAHRCFADRSSRCHYAQRPQSRDR